MTRFRKISAAACTAAALSMAATPAIAADIPMNPAPTISVDGVAVWDADDQNAERHRRYRHRRNRVDAGDVLAGVLIIGGIAAIASAATRNKRERSYPVNQPRYRDSRGDTRSSGGQGIDGAVDMCLREIERDVRVNNVDNVNRSGEGWNVTGTIYNGDSFSCSIGNDGRVDSISYGGRVAVSNVPTEDRQWDDERYRQARQAADQQADEPQTALVETEPTGPQPAYPGGPIDGDLEREGELGG